MSETDTHHLPGIQIADIAEILEHGARIMVLSRGMELRLHTCPETLEQLRRAGIAVHVEETRRVRLLYESEELADRTFTIE